MTELQGHEDRLEISADGGVFVRSRAEGSHGRSRVGGSAPSLCQRARCYQSHPWDLHPAPGIRHRGRDLGEVVSFGQKPDRLKVPCRGHIRARPVLLLQSRNAQMIRHMRHGSSPRLMALQPIRVPDPGESHADSISRSSYQALFNACAAQGGGGWDHSALVRALELMANHNIGGRAESAQVGLLSDEPTFVWRLLNLNL